VLLGVCGFAAVLWTLVRTPGRLNRHRAAAWLDGTQATQGLFQASIEALERLESRPFDEAILTRANKTRVYLGLDRSVRYPWRRLGLRFLVTALATLIIWAALPLVPQTLPGVRKEFAPVNAPTSEPAASERLSLGKPDSLSPRDTARRLFPEDPRLAALAEQALTSGDPQALDDLLKTTDERTQSQGQRPGTYQKRQGPGAGGYGVPGLESEPGSPEGESAAQGDASERQAGPDSPASPPAEGSAGSAPGGKGSPNHAPEPGARGGSPSGGGTAPGFGHTDAPLGARPWARPSDKSVVIPDKNQPGFFEYVMPGSGVRMPLAQALPHAQRTAEAALDRSSPPEEFTQTIEHYFLFLSQEVKP
jgi:hypothetical protein